MSLELKMGLKMRDSGAEKWPKKGRLEGSTYTCSTSNMSGGGQFIVISPGILALKKNFATATMVGKKL